MLWWDLARSHQPILGRQEDFHHAKAVERRLVAIGLCAAFLLHAASAAETTPPWHADLAEIRQMAGMIPGPKTAPRQRDQVRRKPAHEEFLRQGIAGRAERAGAHGVSDRLCRRHDHGRCRHGPSDPSVLRPRRRRALFPEAEARVAQGCKRQKPSSSPTSMATMSAGLIRSEHSAELAPKTMLTSAQLETLINAPQMPELRRRQRWPHACA